MGEGEEKIEIQRKKRRRRKEKQLVLFIRPLTRGEIQAAVCADVSAAHMKHIMSRSVYHHACTAVQKRVRFARSVGGNLSLPVREIEERA